MSVDRLSIGDLMMLWSEQPSTPMQIGLAAVLDGRPSIDAVRASVHAALDRAPSLRRRLHPTGPGQGRPVWVDDPAFAVERHVVEAHVPAALAGSFPTWAATTATEELDRRSPPWRIVVATGLTGERTGLVFVAHHSMADGMELGRLAGALMDSAGPATPRQWHPAAAPSGVQLMRDAIARRAKGTWGLVSAPDRRHRPHSMLRELREGLRAVGTRAPDVGLPAPRTAERRMELRSWQLDRVISIAHAHLVSVNDVALTMIAHGMGDLLSSRGVDITGLSLRVSIPVASPPGRHNVGGTPPIVVDLPIDQAPPATLHRISVQTSAAKTTWDRHHSGLATSELAPRFLVRLSMVWLRRHAAERINLYVTNVPGPSEPLSLAGYQLTSAFPLPPLIAGVPLAVGVLSYHGSLCVAVNTTPAVDLTPLADGLDAALDDLE